MIKERQLQIKNSLKGLGTKADEMYTNEEIIQNLKDLQDGIANIVFERSHAENLNAKDVLIHINALAEEYGLENDSTYKRLKKNMNHLQYTILTYIRGMKGENACRKGLKLIFYDKDVEILYNLALDDGETNTEYDALVVTPYGLFIVEVKNWSNDLVIDPNGCLKKPNKVSYDLPGRLGIKEALLKQYLKDTLDIPVHSILMLPEPKSLDDQYHKVDVCIGIGISSKIREYNTGEMMIDSEKIPKIVSILQENAAIQKSLCDVDCDVIIEDFASFITNVEELASQHKQMQEKQDPEDLYKEDCSWPSWIKKIGLAGLMFSLGAGITYVSRKHQKK